MVGSCLNFGSFFILGFGLAGDVDTVLLDRWPTGKDPVLLFAVCLGLDGAGEESPMFADLWPTAKLPVLLLAVWIGRFALFVSDWLWSLALAFPSEFFTFLAGGGLSANCPFAVTSPWDPKLIFMLILLAASGCLRFFPAALPGVAVVPA